MKQITVTDQRFLHPCTRTDGVAAATVDYEEGRLTALKDSSKTTRPALEDALEKREVKLKEPTKAPRTSHSTDISPAAPFCAALA